MTQHGTLQVKANLGAISDQTDFSQMTELSFQPLPGDRLIQFPHLNGGVIQQPAQAQTGAHQIGWMGYLPSYAAQTNRPALINTNDQPDTAANLGDTFVRSQFSNPLKPGMTQAVDRYVATRPSKFSKEDLRLRSLRLYLPRNAVSHVGAFNFIFKGYSRSFLYTEEIKPREREKFITHDYVVIYINQRQWQLTKPVSEFATNQTPEFTARFDSLDYARVYKNP